MSIYVGQDYSAMQGPAPSGFHVPLATEWQGLDTIMTSLSLTTGDSWKINLHMPFAGGRGYYSADLGGQGYFGKYWSSSPYANSPSYASNLYLDSSSVISYNDEGRASGLSVRCFKDSFELPTSSWTVIAGTLGSAGIFWNQTEGLISITSDGTTGYTIQDKNLGATTVYNGGDTLTQANMGNMYQWGNNYGFPSTGSVSKTSSTQVNASKYGPGTTNGYYESDTCITRSSDRSSVRNDNLRGGVTGVKTGEVKNIYIGEYGWKPGENTLAYYPLETDTNDYSGNNRNGTNNGVTFSDGLGVFNGSSYVSLGTDSRTNIQTNMTISAWFKWNGGGSRDNAVVGKTNYIMPYYYDAYYIISIHDDDRFLLGGFYNGADFNIHPMNFRTSGGGSPTLGPVTQANKWYHVVITNDGTTKKAYVNGSLYATETANSTTATISIDLRIGSFVRYNYDSYFNGNISKVIFEDKTWTAQEISDYYNQTKSNYGL